VGSVEPSGDTATCLYRICQESLTNIGRHARATEAEVCLTEEGGWLTLQVSDNGSGFHYDALAPATSLGILGMRERARIAGGSLEVSTAPGKGTLIVALVPLSVECVLT
jgi:two-component system sensor kinase